MAITVVQCKLIAFNSSKMIVEKFFTPLTHARLAAVVKLQRQFSREETRVDPIRVQIMRLDTEQVILRTKMRF